MTKREPRAPLLIYDLPWLHPGIVFFLALTTLGCVAVHLDMKLPVSLGGPRVNSALIELLSILGVFLLAWIPFYMVARPWAWLPKNTLLLLSGQHEKRMSWIVRLGYTINGLEVVFCVLDIRRTLMWMVHVSGGQ
jgi:hypothetical protein